MLPEADQQAIRETIARQLKAFQMGDAEAAFALAAPGIQARFRTPDQFVEMVMTAYPAVWRPRSVLFAETGTVRDLPTQTVLLLDAEGRLQQALYLMQRESGGEWRIAGCLLQPLA